MHRCIPTDTHLFWQYTSFIEHFTADDGTLDLPAPPPQLMGPLCVVAPFIGPSATMVYLDLTMVNLRDTTATTMRRIAKRCRLSSSTVGDALATLEACGLITVERLRPKARRYTLVDIADPQVLLPVVKRCQARAKAKNQAA